MVIRGTDRKRKKIDSCTIYDASQPTRTGCVDDSFIIYILLALTIKPARLMFKARKTQK